VTASIYLDDKLIAKLQNGRYFAVLSNRELTRFTASRKNVVGLNRV